MSATARKTAPMPADILARKGILGLEGQKLCVQVKSSESSCDVTVFRGLQGSMQTFMADRIACSISTFPKKD